MPQTKFYAYLNFFTLTDVKTGDSKDINEPVGWDGVRINLKRDPALYGFNYEFADDEETLQFAHEDGGANFIRAIYDRDGGDGIITMAFGDINGNTRTTLYMGTLNLNEYKKETELYDVKTNSDAQYSIKCPVEKQSFEGKYRSRYETKIALNATSNLDGGTITPPTSLNILLTSKEIFRQAEYKSNEEYPPEFTFPTSNVNFIGDHELWFTPDFQTNITSELTGFSGGVPGLLKDDPVNDHIWQYKPDEGGILTLSYRDSFTVNVLNNFSAGDLGQVRAIRVYMQPYIRQYRAGILIEDYRPTALANYYEKNNQNVGEDFVFNYTMPVVMTHMLTVLQNDEVYIGIRMYQDEDAYGANADFRKAEVRTIQSHITAAQNTKQPDSNAIFYRWLDAYKQCVAASTGIGNLVTAPAFDTGGCLERYAITNGYQIRRFPGDYPVQTSSKECVENVQALFNIGIGYRGTGFQDNEIFVAPMMTFFGGERIAIIQPSYADYVEEHDKGKQFNESLIGFTKYSDSQVNTIDDYSTYKESLLPLTTFKAKKTIQCGYIASGYLFEEARREQFKTSPSTSLGNDDALFVLNYSSQLKPVNDADFVSVTGVYSPQTAYNLNITPTQMQYYWAPFFNMSLYVKAATEIIQTPFFKQNKELTRQYDTTNPCFSDMPSSPIREGDAISLSNYKYGVRPYTPRRVSFTTAIDWDDLNAIKASLRGENGDDKDFGFITFVDNEGAYQDAHIDEIEYSPADRVAKIVCYVIGETTDQLAINGILISEGQYLLQKDGYVILIG